MHVCHICDTSIETDYFKNLAIGLVQNGLRVSLIDLGPGKPPKWLLENPNISYLSLNAASKWQYPPAVRRLSRFLKDEAVDILHAHLFFSGLISIFAKRKSPRTIVALMRHHTSVVRMLGSRLHIAADKWMAERADRLMTVSNAARSYMIEVDKIDRSDIEVVYLGFDFDKLSPNEQERYRVRNEFDFDEEDFVIGYVGSFAPGKGQRQLIKAFAKIVAEIPGASLFLVGRSVSPEIETSAANFPEGKIVFAGWRDDIPACLNAMDIFVQPSLSEAFSQVIIEAMGVGLPVIATNVGGAKEVIENGINGILIEPKDPEAIYLETVRLYHDRTFRKKIAAAGMQSVRERFRAEQMVERQIALYKSWMDE